MTVATTAAVNLVRCAVGNLVVGFDLARTVGVERGDRLEPVPDTPDAIGVVRTRRGEWPVYPLGTWLGLDTEGADPRTGQIVLVESAHGKFGLAVDRVFPVARVDRGHLLPPPGAVGPVAAWLIAGVVLAEAGPLVVLDPHRLDPRAGGGTDLPLPPAAPSAATPATASAGDRLLLLARSELPGGRAVALGVPVGMIAEVFDPGPGSAVPSAPEHLRELVVWRDLPIALVDAAVWVGLPPTPPSPRRAVVIRAGGLALAVATGGETRTLPAATPSLPTRRRLDLRSPRVLGTFDTTDVTVVVPNWPRLGLAR